MDWLRRIHEAIVDGQKHEIADLVTKAVDDGVSALNLVNDSIIPGMNDVSEKWRMQEYYIPEVLRSATTMQTAMDALKPFLVSGEYGKSVSVAVGTVKGDLHDIGKNIVAVMLEGVGFQVENLGIDLPPERFIEAARNGAKVIGLSSLLSTSMQEMKNVIDLFEESGIRDTVTIIVGGAPITQEFAHKIGADYYAADAAEAVDILNNLFD